MMDKDNFLYQKAKDMAEEVSFSHAFVKNVAVRILFFSKDLEHLSEEEQKIRSKIKLCLLWFWSSDKSVLWAKWRRRDFYPPKNRSHGIIPSRERFRFMFESVVVDQDISWKWWRIHSLKLDTYILTVFTRKKKNDVVLEGKKGFSYGRSANLTPFLLLMRWWCWIRLFLGLV